MLYVVLPSLWLEVFKYRRTEICKGYENEAPALGASSRVLWSFHWQTSTCLGTKGLCGSCRGDESLKLSVPKVVSFDGGQGQDSFWTDSANSSGGCDQTTPAPGEARPTLSHLMPMNRKSGGLCRPPRPRPDPGPALVGALGRRLLWHFSRVSGSGRWLVKVELFPLLASGEKIQKTVRGN